MQQHHHAPSGSSSTRRLKEFGAAALLLGGAAVVFTALFAVWGGSSGSAPAGVRLRQPQQQRVELPQREQGGELATGRRFLARASSPAPLGGTAATTSAAPSPLLPQRFKDDEQGVARAEAVRPQNLSAHHASSSGELKSWLAAVPVVSMHWVVISCDRHLYGRMISQSLLSGLANGLRPTTISIVWCKPYDPASPSSYPDLLHELRHSRSVNVFFPDSSLAARVSPAAMHMLERQRLGSTELRKTDPSYITALMVPRLLGRPDLPLLISQDDTVFAPDANARLAVATQSIQRVVQRDPFVIQLYDASDFKPAPEKAEDVRQRQAASAFGMDPRNTMLVDDFRFGAQAYFFSPGMTVIMLNYWLEMLQPNRTHENLGQDLHIMFHLRDRLQCNKPGSHCWYYMMNPAMTQHIGTSSSLFNSAATRLNQKWHLSESFPVRVALPGYAAEGAWRRRRSRRAMA